VLDIARPENHWNCEGEAQPKLVTKHGDGVAGMTVMTCMVLGHLVTNVWVSALSVYVVCHVVHFELRNQQNSPLVALRFNCFVLQRKANVLYCVT
jgi:hypothetical protein